MLKDEIVQNLVDEIFPAANEVYEEKMCWGAGCCGDIHGAIEKAVRLTAEKLIGEETL